MTTNAKLKEGQKVTVSIPFSYTIGEEGLYINKVLETVEDCLEEAKLDLEANVESGSQFYFETSVEDIDY